MTDQISLVGCKHKAVFVEGFLPAASHDEIAQIFQDQCGIIEKRGNVGERHTIVFKNFGDAKKAVQLHNMMLRDCRLVVWGVEDPPPSGAATQLALSGPSGATSGGESQDSAIAEAVERRARAQKFFEESIVGGFQSDEEKKRELMKITVRQMRALNVLMEDRLVQIEKQREMAEKMRVITAAMLEQERQRLAS